jgi:hypothetical protein
MPTTNTSHGTGTTPTDLAASLRTVLVTAGLLALVPLATLALVLGVGMGAITGLLGAVAVGAVGFTALVGLPFLAVRVGTVLARRSEP